MSRLWLAYDLNRVNTLSKLRIHWRPCIYRICEGGVEVDTRTPFWTTIPVNNLISTWCLLPLECVSAWFLQSPHYSQKSEESLGKFWFSSDGILVIILKSYCRIRDNELQAYVTASLKASPTNSLPSLICSMDSKSKLHCGFAFSEFADISYQSFSLTVLLRQLWYNSIKKFCSELKLKTDLSK